VDTLQFRLLDMDECTTSKSATLKNLKTANVEVIQLFVTTQYCSQPIVYSTDGNRTSQ